MNRPRTIVEAIVNILTQNKDDLSAQQIYEKIEEK